MPRPLTLLLGTAAAVTVYVSVVRPWQLNWGATTHETTRPLAGDYLVPTPTLRSTRAVTVDATPDAIWPWLIQAGTGRAGWYSYDLVDNFGRRSADRIIDEFQGLSVGDIVPLTSSGNTGFVVAELHPPMTMVWSTDHDTTWTWQLEPQRDGTTRLLSRVRFRLRPNPLSIAIALAMELGDGIMMRKMLLTIRSRVENAA